jgi:NurA-like 5'-3' nuclease
MKRYSILVDWNEAAQATRIQLRDSQGNRPGTRPATPNHPARSYMKYYRNAAAGVANFTRFREELERLVN